jgi:hypothetical protein
MVSSRVQAATKEWVSLGVGGRDGAGGGGEVVTSVKYNSVNMKYTISYFLSNDVIYEIIGEHDLRTVF